MKVLVFLEHDIICRNFVMSGALSSLARSATVKFVFPEEGGKRITLQPSELPLQAPFERLPVDDVRQQTWRWLLFAEQMRPRFGDQERAIRRLRIQTLGWKASILFTLASLPIGSAIFAHIVRGRLDRHPNRELANLLDLERPDVILHPSVLDSVFLNDLVVECAAREVPLVVAMNSWDNPSTKRAVVGKPDLLLVWGPQTRNHADRFMGLATDQILEFGAAQFDVFLEPPRLDRAAYCAAIGIEPRNTLVLFAGSNARVDEVATLTAIDEAMSRGELPGVSVVYRPHPWGGGGRDGARLASAQWTNVRIDPAMKGYIDSLSRDGRHMSLPDARDTHDLLSYADVVVSPLSTILLEAMLHGKSPVAFIPSDVAGSQLMANNLPMLHFKEFLQLPEVAVSKSINELVGFLTKISPPTPEQSRSVQRAAEWFVKPFALPWRSRIVDLLFQVAGRGAKRAAGAQP